MTIIVHTIGHSTRPIEAFIELIEAHEIELVIDVRTIAKSRHNPQYNEGPFSESLAEHGIGYARVKGLGGLRRTPPDSINSAWRNLSFRGYADYTQTAEFEESLNHLIELSSEQRTVIMCAEAVPWRCHRSLIGDALLVRGIGVVDIISDKSSKPHKLTPFARVDGYTITYPG